MASKLDPGLRAAIKVILQVRRRYLSGSAEWSTCDEILHDLHGETNYRSMQIAEELDDLPH